MKKVFYLIVLIVFSSCKQKKDSLENYERKSVENKYSVLIPNLLNKTSGLNNYTSFEYENLEQDFYLIIMDEPKEGFLNAIKKNTYDASPNINGYYKVILNHFKEETNIKDFEVFDEIFELSEVDKKITFSMKGVDKDDNYPAFYRYSIIESKTRYYQIMSWTNQSNSKKLIPIMNEIINSFEVEENY